MMRIRTVKPELFTDDELYDAEVAEKLPLRLAYIGIWCACDREGRFEWRPRQLGATILPFDCIPFEKVLDSLVARGFLIKYRVKNEWFGFCPNFLKHQQVNNREHASKIPDVSKGEQLTENESTCEARVRHASITREARRFPELNGTELNGTELNGTELNGTSLSQNSKNGISNSCDGFFETPKVEAPPVKPETKKEKKPRKKNEPKQLNGYNPVSIWSSTAAFELKIPSAPVGGQEAKLLTLLGNMYDEQTFKALLKAYFNDCLMSSNLKIKPVSVSDLHRQHLHYRSKARVGAPGPGSMETLLACDPMAGGGGMPDDPVFDKLMAESKARLAAKEKKP